MGERIFKGQRASPSSRLEQSGREGSLGDSAACRRSDALRQTRKRAALSGASSRKSDLSPQLSFSNRNPSPAAAHPVGMTARRLMQSRQRSQTRNAPARVSRCVVIAASLRALYEFSRSSRSVSSWRLSCAMMRLWIWQTRLSERSSTRPISFIVSSSR